MRKLLPIAVLLALAACTFNPNLTGDKYWPCRPDGSCPGECECLNGQVCIPKEGMEPKHCAWCSIGETVCYGDGFAECARLIGNSDHCGDCWNACSDSQVCEYGNCVDWCRDGLIECDRGCVNPETDPYNCGGCGNTCRPDQVCSFGMCDEGCPEKTEPCSGACVDIHSDPAHCGGCDNACRLENATARCVDGTCVIFECLDCYQDCDQLDRTGCETCPESDPQNCGECGVVCDDPPPPVCEGNELIFYLDTGDCVSSECRYQSSAKPCPYGCENGACIDDLCVGVTCNSNQHCEDGSCVCDYLYGDCDTNNLNGCETYLNTVENCGECENTCGRDSICVDGACNCMYGFGNCNDNWGDGCEEDLLHNQQHCGTCHSGCAIDLTCCGGSCVDTDTDRGNCGRCNFFCSGFDECCQGVCTDTQLNPENCGGCGNVCSHPTSTCCYGSCVDLQTNDTHCGECYFKCAEGVACTTGTCGGTGVDCEGVVCDLWEERCCWDGNGFACMPTTACTAYTIECDGEEDCNDGFQCCFLGGSQYASQCMTSCPQNIVCTSDEYCRNMDASRGHCCQTQVMGKGINICQSEVCP